MQEMRDVLVSIVIPVWGGYEKFLPGCLESAHAQLYKNIEVIVSNGCTDLPSARNAGIKEANGEYVICLDVDDRLVCNSVSRAMEEGGDIIAFDRVSSRGELMTVEKKFSFYDFLKGNRIIACSFFKRKIWEKIGGYDESMKDGYEDWDFWVRAVAIGYKVSYIDEPLYLQRVSSDSMINKTKEKHLELKKYICSKHKKIIL